MSVEKMSILIIYTPNMQADVDTSWFYIVYDMYNMIENELVHHIL